MTKKIISVLIILSILLGSSVSYAWENEKTDSYEHAKELLLKLDIMDMVTKNGHKDSDIITRGELADVVMRMSGVYDTAGYADIFSDVTQETPYANSISNLTAMGVIARADKYNPDEPALYEHALKMLVYLLGYEVAVEYNGGWLNAILRQADDLGITTGINASIGQKLNAGLLEALCYNTLDCEVLKKDMNKAEYTSDKDKTLLSENFDIYKVKGIVTETSLSSLTGSGVPYNAKIGNIRMTDKKSESNQYLGEEAIAYYHKDSIENELIYIYPTYINQYIKVTADQLNANHLGFGYTSIYYDDTNKGRSEKIKVSSEADIIYNGKAYPSYTIEDYKIKSGYLKFIDNNGDNTADVVFIEEHENYVVNTTDSENMKVYDMYNKVLELKNTDNISIKDMYGNDVKFKDIKKWDVLSVKMSKDKNNADITIYNDPVTGDIQSIRTEKGIKYVTIDGDTFAIAKSYEEALASGSANAKEISLEQSGTYYLDADEKIAAAALDEAYGWRYAYLIKAYCDEDDKAGFKLYYDATGMKRLEAKEKIIIDGYKKQGKEIADYFNDGSGDTEPQLIKFMTDGNGIVSRIDTVQVGSRETDENLTRNVENGKGYYSIRTRRVGNGENMAVKINPPSTMVFQIPQASKDKYDESKYGFITSSFENNKALTYDAYDIDTTGQAKAVVVKMNLNQKSSYFMDEIIIVTNIETRVNSDNEIDIAVLGRDISGNAVELTFEDNVDISKITVGDLFAYGLNYKNKVDYIPYMFDHETGESFVDSTYISEGENNIGTDYDYACKLFNEIGDYDPAFNANAKSRLIASVIAEKNGSYIKAVAPAENGEAKNYFAAIDKNDYTKLNIYEESCQFYSSAPVQVYLCEGERVTQISWEDLEEYVYERNNSVRVLFYSTYSQLRGLYVYN